jgi:BTB/POZ domain
LAWQKQLLISAFHDLKEDGQEKEKSGQSMSQLYFSHVNYEPRLILIRYLSEMTPKTTVRLSLGLKKPIKTWTLSEKLLCDHSSYFRAAFRGKFKESSARRSFLDEEMFSEKTVAHLIDWMYTGRLECHEPHDSKNSISTHDSSWYSLYMLADMLDIACLAKAAIHQIHECLEVGDWLPSQKDITYIYSKADVNHNLQEIVVKALVDAFLEKTSAGFAEGSEAWSEVLAADLDFSRDVLEAIKRHTDMVECDRRVSCRFHFTHRPARKRRKTLR